METAHEVAIYIDRFHNLDLFHQGWYRMKISAAWEQDDGRAPVSPARVDQYEEATDVGARRTFGFWKIDDGDSSFYTQPFRIKYARQDIYLSLTVSFHIPNSEDEGPTTSSVILKFELLYVPTLGNRIEIEDSSDKYVAPVHEFRIPHRALLGLHTYCPVHFDAFHPVLVDLTIHIVYLKAGVTKSSLKAFEQGSASKSYDILKALLTSRELLLEDVKTISNVIGQTLEDLDGTDLTLGKYESVHPTESSFSIYTNAVIANCIGKRGMLQDLLQMSDDVVESTNDVVLYILSNEELLELFETVSNQLTLIWNGFLKFHRSNRMKILDYLHDIWDVDRKSEWSIWIVHSKIEIPHQYMHSVADSSTPCHSLRRASSSKKLHHHDPVHNASSRAELHRKSIAQMKIDARSVQDMHIYANPSHVPVVLIEQHVMVVPQHVTTKDLLENAPDPNNITVPPNQQEDSIAGNTSGGKNSGHILRAVIFVHGFQGHHLDLCLIRNQWLLRDPGAECLLSETNEDRTYGDFKEMGRRLANEVLSFLRSRLDKYSRHGGCKEFKISFVGHSIGNIIIRSALSEPKLQPFLKNLYTYMSISGPHLGYWYSSNSLFNSGLWLMKRIKGLHCMHQLTFTDEHDPQNTFLYRLCELKTLENFKNIILVSSPQDGYVPYHSARMDLCPASSSDSSKKGQVFIEMLNNCLDQIRAPTSEERVFMRCDVSFDQHGHRHDLNSMVGRAAHVEFLENDIYARFIMWSFPELFRQ